MLLLLFIPLFLLIGLYYYGAKPSWEVCEQCHLPLSPPRLKAKLQQLRTWPNWWEDTAQQDTLFFFRGEAKGAGASMQWERKQPHHLVITQVQKQRLRYIHRIGETLQLEGLLYWERTTQGSQLCWETRPLNDSAASYWQSWRCYFSLKHQLPKRLQRLGDYYNEI